MKIPVNTKRDIARELARRYSTMTHEELDALESILVCHKYAKGEMILKEGDVCRNIYYLDRGLIRQFYFRENKELTEHIGCDHSIFMCRLWSSRLSGRCRKPTLSVLLSTTSTSR